MTETDATPPSAPPATPEHGTPEHANPVAVAAALPFALAERLLPDSPVPVALGATALAVAGVIEWPVAAAVGLGYLALRRWGRHDDASRTSAAGAR